MILEKPRGLHDLTIRDINAVTWALRSDSSSATAARGAATSHASPTITANEYRLMMIITRTPNNSVIVHERDT